MYFLHTLKWRQSFAEHMNNGIRGSFVWKHDLCRKLAPWETHELCGNVEENTILGFLVIKETALFSNLQLYRYKIASLRPPHTHSATHLYTLRPYVQIIWSKYNNKYGIVTTFWNILNAQQFLGSRMEWSFQPKMFQVRSDTYPSRQQITALTLCTAICPICPQQSGICTRVWPSFPNFI